MSNDGAQISSFILCFSLQTHFVSFVLFSLRGFGYVSSSFHSVGLWAQSWLLLLSGGFEKVSKCLWLST